MAYAFKDESGILHLTDDRQVAERQGCFVETELKPDVSGYPIVDGKGVILYADGRAFIDGNKAKGTEIAAPQVLIDLAAQI